MRLLVVLLVGLCCALPVQEHEKQLHSHVFDTVQGEQAEVTRKHVHQRVFPKGSLGFHQSPNHQFGQLLLQNMSTDGNFTGNSTLFPCRGRCVHGRCNETNSVCVCELGWEGDLCDIHAFEVGPLYLCHPDCIHGRCINGKCLCDDGWKGEDCGHTGCPDDCSSHGICRRGRCICDKGFYGNNCGSILVPHANGVQLSSFKAYLACSENCVHGVCTESGCKCYDGYFGDGCKAVRCPLDCAGHGSCKDGACNCFSGWSGSVCTVEVPNTPCANNCSFHGLCVSSVCRCFSGWTGHDCSVGLCPENCNLRGICVNAQCICDDGYEGRSCEVFRLENGHGRLIRGHLMCDQGYSLSSNCTSLACPGDEVGVPCFGHGTCNAGACICDRGFQGSKCEVEVVPNANTPHGLRWLEDGHTLCLPKYTGDSCQGYVCNPACQHGVCSSTNICECELGFIGADCSVPWQCRGEWQLVDGRTECICSEGWRGPQCEYRTCIADCNGHGVCDNGTCICELGWSEESACSTRVCDACVHGTCNDGVCECRPGWFLKDCSCPVNCNTEHGDCSSGACVCHTGWGGEECHLHLCPGDCGEPAGHGHCNHTTGICECTEGWQGADCSSQWCANACSCRGTCVGRGECLCESGFSGADCSQLLLPSGHGKLQVIMPETLDRFHCKAADIVVSCDVGWTSVDAELCFSGIGSSYRGKVSKTVAGHTCQRWDTHYPHQHSHTPANFPASGLEENYCRNPDGMPAPWCYPTNGQTREFCDLKSCSDDFFLQVPEDRLNSLCSVRTCDSPPLNNCTSPSNGWCDDGVCRCIGGFKGVDCSKPSCVNDCNRHGYCDPELLQCICNPLYEGEDCEFFRIPLPSHGVRDSSETVFCDPGWMLPTCVELICPNNCSNTPTNWTLQNRCHEDTRTCDCPAQWTGPDCSERAVLPCGEHGRLNNASQCECDFGAAFDDATRECVLPSDAFLGLDGHCPFCDPGFCNWVYPHCAAGDDFDMEECQRFIEEYCAATPTDPGCCCGQSFSGNLTCPLSSNLRCMVGETAGFCLTQVANCSGHPPPPQCTPDLVERFNIQPRVNTTTGLGGGTEFGSLSLGSAGPNVTAFEFKEVPTATPEPLGGPENCYNHGNVTVVGACECFDGWLGTYCSLPEEDCRRARELPKDFNYNDAEDSTKPPTSPPTSPPAEDTATAIEPEGEELGCFEAHTEIGAEHDLEMITDIPSAEGCQSLCSSIPACKFFTIDVESGNCTLKDGDADKNTEAPTSYITGPKVCPVGTTTTALAFSCPFNCYDHGLCEPPPAGGTTGWCRCFDRWKTTQTFCKDPVCPKDCSGRGWCKRRCICFEGYTGEDCSKAVAMHNEWKKVEFTGLSPGGRAYPSLVTTFDRQRLFYELLDDLLAYWPLDIDMICATGEVRDAHPVGILFYDIYSLEEKAVGRGSLTLMGSGYIHSDENVLLSRDEWAFAVWFKAGEPTPEPTPVPAGEGCVDSQLQDGGQWHDTRGPEYSCMWYSAGDRCTKFGEQFQNGKYTAKTACCACGGGEETMGCSSKMWSTQSGLGGVSTVSACEDVGGETNSRKIRHGIDDEAYSVVVQTLIVESYQEYSLIGKLFSDTTECDLEVSWWCGATVVVCPGSYNPDFYKPLRDGGVECFGKATSSAAGSWEDFSISFTSDSSRATVYLLQPPAPDTTSAYTKLVVTGVPGPVPTPRPTPTGATPIGCGHSKKSVFSTTPSGVVKIEVNAGKVTLSVEGTCPNCYKHPRSIAGDNQWHHVAFSYVTGLLRIFFDGKLVKRVENAPRPTGSSEEGFNIGADASGGSRWCGWIDDVAVWSRQLSVGDVSLLYNRKPVLLDPLFDVDPPQPTAFWKFRSVTSNVGSVAGKLFGKAALKSGSLRLPGGNGNFLGSVSLPQRLSDKTLEVWVALDTLGQSGGGAMVVEKLDGSSYDGIAFGELQPKKWLPTSEVHSRTQDNGAPAETTASLRRYIHLAIVYQETSSGTCRVTMYRNGKPHGSSYVRGKMQAFDMEDSHIVFGIHHSLGQQSVGQLEGKIKCAALYAKSLSEEEIEASFRAGCELDKAPDRAVLYGGMTVGKGSTRDIFDFQIKKNEFQGLVVGGSRAPIHRYGQAVAYSSFTNRIWLFGGIGETSGGPGAGGNTRFLNDMWYYDFQRWVKVPYTLPWPHERMHATLVPNRDGSKLFLFGGSYYLNYNVVMNDLWTFYVAEKRWEKYESCHLTLTPDASEDPRKWRDRTDKQAWMPDATERTRHSIYVDTHMMFDSPGVVTAWQFPVKVPGVHFLQVWRGQGQSFTLVGETKIESDLKHIQTFIIPRKERIFVQKGDVVGWRHDGPGILGWDTNPCHPVKYFFVKPEDPPPPPPVPAYCDPNEGEEVKCESTGEKKECETKRPVCDIRVKEFISKGDDLCQLGQNFDKEEDQKKFWVDKNCKAVFVIKYPLPGCSSKGCCPGPVVTVLDSVAVSKPIQVTAGGTLQFPEEPEEGKEVPRQSGDAFEIAMSVSGVPGSVSLSRGGFDYLRTSSFNIFVNPFSNDDMFKTDASWFLEPALNGAQGAVSFRSVGFPEHYFVAKETEFSLTDSPDPAAASFQASVSRSPFGAGCPDAFWVPLGKDAERRCYRVFPCESCTFDAAKQLCESHEGKLASITSNKLKLALGGLVTGDWAHVGATCDSEDDPCPLSGWKWLDDASTEFLKKPPQEENGGLAPDQPGKTVVLGKTLALKSHPQGQGANGAICQKKLKWSDCAPAEIKTSSYGKNCDSKNEDNALEFTKRTCDGRYGCNFHASMAIVGKDPAFGCHKEFAVKWKCGTMDKEIIVGEGCEETGGGSGATCEETTGKLVVADCSPGEGVGDPPPPEEEPPAEAEADVANEEPGGDPDAAASSGFPGSAVAVAAAAKVSLLEIGAEVALQEEAKGCPVPCPAPILAYRGVRMLSHPGTGLDMKIAIDKMKINVTKPDEPPEYCEITNGAPLWVWNSNHKLCGVYRENRFVESVKTSNIGIKYEVSFYEPCGGGRWQWKFKVDFSGGGVMFLDDNIIWEDYTDKAGELEFNLGRMDKGMHTLQLYGYEECCDEEKGGIQFLRLDEPGTFLPVTYNAWPQLVCKADCTDYGMGFTTITDYWVQPKPEFPKVGSTVTFEKETTHLYSIAAIWDRSHSRFGLSEACPAGRHGHSASFYNGKMYVFGGIRNAPIMLEDYLNDLWVFEVATGTWFEYGGVVEARAGAPAPRAGACIGVETALGDVIVTMGYGPKPKDAKKKEEPEDENEDEAQDAAPEGISEEDAAADKVAQEAVKQEAAAKEAEQNAKQMKEDERALGFRDVWRYNFEQNMWVDLDPTPDGTHGKPLEREHAGCALVDKRLYLYGGHHPNRNSEALDDMWYYDFHFDMEKEVKEKGGSASCVQLLRNDPTLEDGIQKISPPKLKDKDEAGGGGGSSGGGSQSPAAASPPGENGQTAEAPAPPAQPNQPAAGSADVPESWILVAYADKGQFTQGFTNAEGTCDGKTKGGSFVASDFLDLLKGSTKMAISWNKEKPAPQGDLTTYEYAVEFELPAAGDMTLTAEADSNFKISAASGSTTMAKISVSPLAGEPGLPAEMYMRSITFGARGGKAYGIVMTDNNQDALDWEPNEETYKAVYLGKDGAEGFVTTGGSAAGYVPTTMAVWVNSQSAGGCEVPLPDTDPKEFEVYCDMTTFGGGWTLVAYAENCLLAGMDLESFAGTYDPVTRTGSANVNALRVAQVSSEVLYSWDNRILPTKNIKSYANAVKHFIPEDGLDTMKPLDNTADNNAYEKMPIEVVQNVDGISLPREMYTRKGSLMVAFNKGFGLVREPPNVKDLDWDLGTEAYSAIYVGLPPERANAGVATLTSEGKSSVVKKPRTCAIWMR